jgi:hypothetical protein
VDSTKKVYLIVHGQRNLIDSVKDSLSSKFKRENMEPASLDRAGNEGEYVAMLWPPRGSSQIIVSRITGKTSSSSHSSSAGGGGMGMGAWASVKQEELFRVPLSSSSSS